MARRLEHVEAANQEAIRLGATFDYEYGSKHIYGIISINGKQRKIFLSKTVTAFRICHVVREDVRRKVKEMMK